MREASLQVEIVGRILLRCSHLLRLKLFSPSAVSGSTVPSASALYVSVLYRLITKQWLMLTNIYRREREIVLLKLHFCQNQVDTLFHDQSIQKKNPPLQPNDHKRLMTEKNKEGKIGGVSDPNLIIKENAQVIYIDIPASVFLTRFLELEVSLQ